MPATAGIGVFCIFAPVLAEKIVMIRFIHTYSAHYKALLRLGVPIVIAQFGIVVFAIADTLMVGHHAVEELSSAGFVNNTFNMATVASIGFALGLTPVVAIYSSFLQRAYDQILHDVCIQNLHVVFAIDRAGLVGSDGETHQGIFDLSYLGSIPNMTVLSPKHKWELADMLRFALCHDGPVAIRYPRGAALDQYQEYRAPVEYGKSEMIVREKGIALVSIGHMFEEAEEVRRRLKEKGYDCTLVNGRFVKPIDQEMIRELSKTHDWIVTLEENVETGGYGQQVQTFVCQENLPVRVLIIALPDAYIEHGNVSILRKEAGIDADSVVKKIERTIC